VTEGEAAKKQESAAASAVRGMYHLFLGNTTYTVLLAITAIIVGRVLGPDRYGLYTIALILPPFAFLAGKFGLDSAATRYAARLRSEGLEKEAVSFAYATTIVELAISLVIFLPLVWLSGAVSSQVLNRPELGSVVLRSPWSQSLALRPTP
jgi:O-antigen/teichoic acid export membrane protein